MFFCIFVGCGEKTDWLRDDPEWVLSSYLMAVEAGATETMWEYYTTSTRQHLETRLNAYRQAHPEASVREAHAMIFPGHVLSSTREYKRIELEFRDSKRAVVNIVLHDSSVIAVELVRESERWAIGLPLVADQL